MKILRRQLIITVQHFVCTIKKKKCHVFFALTHIVLYMWIAFIAHSNFYYDL